MKKLIGYQKGVNLGGWLSQSTLKKHHLDTFITEKDIETIASWGCDHVRVPLDFELIENQDGSVKEEGYVYIDNCIEWCRKNHLNMVLDLHKTYGYIFDDPEYSAAFFHDTAAQDRLIQIWERLATRYAKHTDMMMFELLNEVTRLDVVDEWNQIAARCIKAIRAITPDAYILYGGVGYNAVTAIKWLDEPADDRIVYNFHCYEPLVFTHQSAQWCDGMPADFRINYPDDIDLYNKSAHSIPGAMVGAFADPNSSVTTLGPAFFEKLFREAIDVAEERNVPLYCGEYGVIDVAAPEDTVRWFNDIHEVFEKFGIGRAAWSYKQMDFGLADERLAGVIDQLTQAL